MELILNNQVIAIRESDGFVNATQLCAAAGKKIEDWLNLDKSPKFIKSIERIYAAAYGEKKLVDSCADDIWVYPDVITVIAEWVGLDFLYAAYAWINDLYADI